MKFSTTSHFVYDSSVSLVALILFLAIGLLPIFVREFRNNTRILLVYWFVIALHQIVANVSIKSFIDIPSDEPMNPDPPSMSALIKKFYLRPRILT